MISPGPTASARKLVAGPRAGSAPGWTPARRTIGGTSEASPRACHRVDRMPVPCSRRERVVRALPGRPSPCAPATARGRGIWPACPAPNGATIRTSTDRPRPRTRRRRHLRLAQARSRSRAGSAARRRRRRRSAAWALLTLARAAPLPSSPPSFESSRPRARRASEHTMARALPPWLLTGARQSEVTPVTLEPGCRGAPAAEATISQLPSLPGNQPTGVARSAPVSRPMVVRTSTRPAQTERPRTWADALSSAACLAGDTGPSRRWRRLAVAEPALTRVLPRASWPRSSRPPPASQRAGPVGPLTPITTRLPLQHPLRPLEPEPSILA